MRIRWLLPSMARPSVPDVLISLGGPRSVSTNVTIHALLLLPDSREFARVLVGAPAPESMSHEGRTWRRRNKVIGGQWLYQLVPARLRRR